MKNTVIELVAGLRMLVSKDCLLTLRKVQPGSTQVIDSPMKLNAEGF